MEIIWDRMDIVILIKLILLHQLRDGLMSLPMSKIFFIFKFYIFLILKLFFFISSENAFKVALFKHGPLSIAIDASKRTFTFYSHGVYFDEKCGNTADDLDHAVVSLTHEF